MRKSNLTGSEELHDQVRELNQLAEDMQIKTQMFDRKYITLDNLLERKEGKRLVQKNKLKPTGYVQEAEKVK